MLRLVFQIALPIMCLSLSIIGCFLLPRLTLSESFRCKDMNITAFKMFSIVRFGLKVQFLIT